MRKVKHAITLASIVAMSAIGLYGCGGDNPTATVVAPTATTAVMSVPTATPAMMEEPTATTAAMSAPTATTAMMEEPTATTATTGGNTGGNSGDAINLLKNAGEAMKAVKSYHVVIKTESAGLTSTSEGDFVLPDKVRLVSDVAGTQTTMIIISTTAYTLLPGTDSYIEIPGMTNPMSSASTAGFEDIAEGATVIGDETLDGVDTTHLKFSMDMNKAISASGVTGDITPTPNPSLGMAEAEIWVEKSTGYIHQYKTTSEIAGTKAVSTITYSRFNEEVTPPIEKPANVQQMPTMPTVAP